MESSNVRRQNPKRPTSNLGQRKNTKDQVGHSWGGEGKRGGGWGSRGWEHRWRETSGGYADKVCETLEEGGRGPNWVLVTEASHALEEASSGALPQGAGEDGMLEGFWFQAASGAGGVGVG